MRLGANNDQGQVKLLQAFLSGQAGATVPVTGLFDAQTDTAVRAFQAKYADEILAPWGLSQPTGWVYKLTQWKINALACSTLDAPKPDVQPLGQGGAGDATVASAATASVAGSVTLSNTADDSAVGGAGDATQTAAAANASSTQGWFGSFVGWLFGK
jgi:peptidoglycan hydrolase-like protein with peptidoglycan-binding domain